jgi:hypothetical protein
MNLEDDNSSNDDENISIMDDDIDMSSYNSDDEAMESLAEQQRDHDKAMRKILRNDPSLTTLYINAEMVDDWGVMGAVVGRNTQLKEVIVFTDMGNIPDNAIRDFARGLAFNRSIQTLNIANWNHYDRDYPPARGEAWNHLTQFFIDNEAFECLELYVNMGIDRELLSALQRFGSLKEFKLSNHTDTPGDIRVDDDVIDALIEHHTGLTKLTIDGFDIGRGGCAALATSPLTELYLMRCMNIDDEGARVFSTGLARNTTLKKLEISRNSIDDTWINALTHALLNNCTLKELTILPCVGSRGVTPAVWVNFSTILQNPRSALELIFVRSHSINDDVVQSFTDALANNNKLRELSVENIFRDNIISESYAAMGNILCNTSSILNTFNSNHTLEKICRPYKERSLPNNLSSLLQLNRECSVSEAARIKIINTHFSGYEINMQPFMEMNLNVRPHAIAWMAKDMHVYELLRAMPSLLEQFKDDEEKGRGISD